MNETREQAKPVEQPLSEDMENTWQPPEFTSIDTALEVTAYSLNSR
jgi:coenzyme PQQ precursor peptide PqqA